MADPFFSLDYIDEGQKSAGVAANDFLFVLAAHAHLAVIDRDLNTPPGTIVEGAVYIGGTSPTGAWSGWSGRVIIGHGGAWISFVPKEGWSAWIIDEDRRIHHDGTVWNDSEPFSVQTGITAFATGGQTNAVALTGETCIVSTCATNGDSVKLRAAIKGISQYVKNRGAAACNVFAPSGDSMDGTANGSVSVPAGKGAYFRCVDATDWYSMIGA